MKSYAFLFWAYNVIWILIAAYVGFAMARIGKVTKRIDAIERALKRREESSQRSSSS